MEPAGGMADTRGRSACVGKSRTVRRGTPAERFWARVEKTEGGLGCWLWTGPQNHKGYGLFGGPHKKTVSAHRFAYELSVGPIPEGLHLDHLCRVRHCVNPAHLEPVTCQENVRRWASLITHCPRGHAYDETNTWINRSGARNCRTCVRERARERYRRLKSKRP